LMFPQTGWNRFHQSLPPPASWRL